MKALVFNVFSNHLLKICDSEFTLDKNMNAYSGATKVAGLLIALVIMCN